MFRFVSLGSDCQGAHQINRLQGTGATHFFDWLGSPIMGVMRLIGAHFEGVLDPENLHAYCRENIIYSVIDTRSRLDFSHDFSRMDADTIKRVQNAYRLRARWFLELFDEDSPPTYFVRRTDLRDREDGDQSALKLLQLLQSRRKDVRLLHLHEDPARPPGFAPGFRSVFLPQPTPFHWHGLDHAWTHALTVVARERFADDGDAFPLPERRLPSFTRTRQPSVLQA